RFDGDAASVPVVHVAPPVSNTATPTTTGNTGGAFFVSLVNVPTNSVADGKAKEVLLALYNEARAEAKLPLLKYSSVLEKSAQGHADDLAKTGVGSHTGSDGSDPRTRMTRVGYAGRYAAENWAWSRSAEQAFDMWFNQEYPDGVHRRTILSPNYTEVGIGVSTSRSGYFFIANFGG
ncbi:MAG TPA: CAP domain-containing protein, partial [Thermoflexales bacterium]|nr:CAP domain-containing protein [Thermoflexales bacterium]